MGLGRFWAKGNTHCHTDASDGDSPLDAVVNWYKTHGYQFVVITDHGRAADREACKAASSEGFLVIPGEEVGAKFEGSPIHVNSLGAIAHVEPQTGGSKADTIQCNIDAVVKTGAIPQINHPNWHYAFAEHELRNVENCALLEICNSSSGCNNEGDAAHHSVEQIWDALLSDGKTFYAVAADDAHTYTKPGWEPDWPGRAWVAVRVSNLTEKEVLDALSRGDFYASTGVELEDVSFDGTALRVKVKPAPKATYRIIFIGPHGRVLSEVDGTDGACKISDSYVRAKVISSDGSVAWTQAFHECRKQ